MVVEKVFVVMLSYCLCVSKGYWLQNSTSVEMNGDEPQDQKGVSSTFKEVGEIAVRMVESLAGGDSDIRLSGVSQLLTDLAKAAAYIDKPSLIQKLEMGPDNTYLSEQLADLESKMETKINHLVEENKKLKRVMVQQIKARNVSTVLFEATLRALNSPVPVTTGSRTPVAFREIQSNRGGLQYNKNMGEYTCPVTGYYMVTLTFRTQPDTTMTTMYDDDVNKIKLTINVYGKRKLIVVGGYGTTSGCTVAYCRQGGTVQVEAQGGGSMKAARNTYGDYHSNKLQVYLIRAEQE